MAEMIATYNYQPLAMPAPIRLLAAHRFTRVDCCLHMLMETTRDGAVVVSAAKYSQPDGRGTWQELARHARLNEHVSRQQHEDLAMMRRFNQYYVYSLPQCT